MMRMIWLGRKAVLTGSLAIREYASLMEFVDGMKKTREQGYFVYSSNAKTANEILRDFYPEEYGERKLLSYPIGHFVGTLNRMWDEDRQEIVLEPDAVVECFSSGWLAVEGKAGKPYMQGLTYVLPFFADCRSVSSWRERILLMRDIDEKVLKQFRSEKKSGSSAERWQEVMENPFRNFSMFAVEQERLDVILKLIEQLLLMAEELFDHDEMICVRDYVHKLEKILKTCEISDELYQEEEALIGELFEKLQNPERFSMQVFPSDISSALNLYLSGKI